MISGKPRLTGVFRVRFGHRARGRGLPHRPVVGPAVVVAGEPEQQQERQRQRRVREPPDVGQDLRPEVAGLRHATRARHGRVERRQVVVLGDVVVVLQERPHRRVDDERGEAQIRRSAVTATSGRCAGCAAGSGHGPARRRRSPCGRRWVRSLFPFGVDCDSGGQRPGRPRSSRAAETLVVDVAPEVGVVRGVRDRRFFSPPWW